MRAIVDKATMMAGFLILLYVALLLWVGNFDLSRVLLASVGLALILYPHSRPALARLTEKGVGLAAMRLVQGALVFVVVTMIASFALMAVAASNVPSYDKDAVIVLGAGLRHGEPSAMLALRLDKALAYSRQNESAVVVVTGGLGADQRVTEAFAMKKYLVDRGMDADRIIMEEWSTRTIENLANAKALLDAYFQHEQYTVVIVSNDFHLLRAGFQAAAMELQAEGLASPTPPFFLPMMLFREYFSLMWYFIFNH